MSLSPETRERIQGLVDSDQVFLFMKGNPAAPQCGFSAQVIQILNRLVPSYGSYDVLQDPEVREGIKEFSDWPTIPQLYVRGEFMGGCDIIREMYASGELREALGLPAATGEAPQIEVSEAAAGELRAAQERAGGAELHLSIDARFESTLGLGPPQPGEIEVEAGSVRLRMDRETASRAEGVRIETVETPEGARLTIENPNQPRD